MTADLSPGWTHYCDPPGRPTYDEWGPILPPGEAWCCACGCWYGVEGDAAGQPKRWVRLAPDATIHMGGMKT